MIDARMTESLGRDRIAGDTSRSLVAFSRPSILAANAKLLFFFFLVTLPLVNPWVRGDGVGYYAYLRSALIDHDLRFENDYLAGNESFVLSRVDAQGHLLPEMYTRTGYVENHFSVGPAILWAPVMIPVHWGVLLADRLGAHIPPDGHSRPYLVAMALTTATYGFLALLLAFQIGRKYFDESWAFLATLGIWLASSLPVYMYFNPSWSHAMSAFAATLFLWYWDRTQLHRTAAQWAMLGLMAGLMGDVYYPNIILLMFPGIELVRMLWTEESGAGRERAPVSAMIRNCALFVAALIVSLSPTFITRQIIYGSPFATGYPGMRTWHWTSPALLRVLFSADHGMFSWTPILILAVAGLFLVGKRNALLGIGSILTFLAFYYFIASYPDWDGLSSFGNRFFVSLTPMFILGLTALISSFANWIGKPSRAGWSAALVLALFSLWNLGFIFQWGTHMVPARGEISWSEMAHNQFTTVPMKVTRSLSHYFVNRKDMMQHIEQEDIEQQKQHRIPRD